MIDINGHYIFNRLERFESYAIAGLNILYAHKKEATGITVFKESDNPIGINLGVGTCFKLSEKLDFFGEVKYIFSKYDQFMANGGILFKIDWMKKNDTPGI
jgi:opacity protein-like surface antigen